jgi:hypothetical protein
MFGTFSQGLVLAGSLFHQLRGLNDRVQKSQNAEIDAKRQTIEAQEKLSMLKPTKQ